MKDQSKTKRALIQELASLKQRITELEQSESGHKWLTELLKKTGQELKLIFDASPSLIWQKDLEGRYLQVNKAYCDTVGLSKDTILGKTDYDLFSKEIADQYVNRDRKVLDTCISEFGIEEYHQKPSGEYGWSRTDKLIYYDVDGKINGTIGFATDITERKRAEEALRESEEKYKTLAEKSMAGVYVVQDGKFRFINSNAASYAGYTKEELLDQKAGLLVSPEDKEKVRQNTKAMLLGEMSTPYEFRIITKQGETRWIMETVTSILQDGKPAILGNSMDITEHKQIEGDLRISEERYRTIINNIEEGYYEVDTKGNMTFCNPAAANMLGYRQEELIGLNNQQYMNHENAQKVFSTFNKVYMTGQPTKAFDWELIRRDGEKLIVETSVSLIRDTKEKPVGFRGIFRDTIERKQAEEALRESEEQYRTLVENASDIIFRLDNTGHIIFVNPAALRIMGYEEKEIIGRHYPTFIRSDMQEEAMNFFGRQFVKGIPNTYSEYPVIVKGGREIWLGQNTQLIFRDGKVVAFQAVARDITELKRIGEALQDSENRYRELSIVDELTQLYNSRHFYFQLKIELDRSNRYELPLTLLLLDLDNFKTFNDTYGHIEGDQVLMRLGQVVKRCLRQTDSAYRYGGEEFTILLPMTTSVKGAITAERIWTEFKKETFSPAQGQDVHVTVSIGLGQYKPQEDMKAFVHRVDQLMYQAKKNGKNRVCSES